MEEWSVRTTPLISIAHKCARIDPVVTSILIVVTGPVIGISVKSPSVPPAILVDVMFVPETVLPSQEGSLFLRSFNLNVSVDVSACHVRSSSINASDPVVFVQASSD